MARIAGKQGVENAPPEIRMKINIVVPTHDTLPAMFAYDLAQLTAFTVASMPDKTEIGVTFLPGTYIQCARQELMQHVLSGGDDYVLWLDSDMRFPKESFAHLIQHEVAMVGINYCKKQVLSAPTAIKHIGREGSEKEPKRLYPDDEATGLTEVESIGFGCLLMRMEDFKNMPPLTRGPWFEQTYDAEINQWTGEDTFFCELVRKKLGVKVMVDQDLSRACAHIGHFEYLLDHLIAPDLQEAEA